METYTYKILEVNSLTHSMIIQYTPVDQTLSEINLNIPIPAAVDNVDAHVNIYAPQDTWARSKNPSYDLTSLVGTENTVDPSTIVSQQTISSNEYEIMLQLNNEFLAEQSNTASV